jgi:hypothetical protein
MNRILYAQFTSQKDGISTLADVTIDVDQVNKITGEVVALVTGAVVTSTGNLSPLRNGGYLYVVANVDINLYDYYGTFKTANTTVDLQHVPSLQHTDFDVLNISSGKVLLQDAQITTIATLANQTTIINAVNAIDAGSGTGAFSVAVTVNDGTDALENATVRLTEGANTFTATTDASGIANFSLDGATYAITITKDGYQLTPATITVDATHTEFTKSMTAVTTPEVIIPGTSIIYVNVINDGVAKEGVTIYAELLEARPVLIDSNYEGEITTSKLTSSGGQVAFTCYPGLKYRVKGNFGLDRTVIAPEAGTSANLADLPDA